MGRQKKYPDQFIAGRPPKNPLEKVGLPVRALLTPPAYDALAQAMQRLGLNLSETVRLSIYRALEDQGLMTDELRHDPTWESLRRKGIL